VFSDLSYRMKDNARAFFIVAIISTVAFSAIGTLVGLDSFLTSGLKEANPISFQYYIGEDDQNIEPIEQILADHNLETERAEIELTYFDQDDRSILITTPEMYNAFARLIGEQEIELTDEQVTVVEQRTDNLMVPTEKLEDASITLKNGDHVQVDKDLMGMAKQNVLPEVNHYFIVGEKIYDQLPNAISTEKYVSWQVEDGKQEDIIEAGSILSVEYPG